jgi:hypothetical protein
LNKPIFLAATLLAPCLAAAAVAADQPAPAADPIAAFAETCRRGFPDLQAIARGALASGWVERSIRPVGGNAAFQAAPLPQVFAKGELTLFLTTPSAIGGRHGCQVAGPAARDLDIAAFAAAAASALQLGGPALDRAGGADRATWRLGASTLVQASLNRRPRSASLQIRLEP